MIMPTMNNDDDYDDGGDGGGGDGEHYDVNQNWHIIRIVRLLTFHEGANHWVEPDKRGGQLGSLKYHQERW